MTGLGVDVVDLTRVGRMYADFAEPTSAALLSAPERRALHRLGPDERVLALAAALGVKEAWLKATGRRPGGWRFPDARYEPDGPPGPVEVGAVRARFLADLGLPLAGAGTVPEPAGAPAHAWYARYGDFLIAAVLR
jgi:hypothetical protein